MIKTKMGCDQSAFRDRQKICTVSHENKPENCITIKYLKKYNYQGFSQTGGIDTQGTHHPTSSYRR